MTSGSEPGRGGISRGPGHAELRYDNNTAGATDALTPQKLPPGRVIPKEWQVTGLTRSAPRADPQRAGNTGGAASSGSGEASWRRRVAPHHREVVRRFFTPQSGEPKRKEPK